MNAFLASSENLRKDDALSRYGGWKYATMDKDSEYLNGRIGLTYYLAQIEVEGVIVAAASWDETMLEMSHLFLLDGRFPENNKEIMAEPGSLSFLKYDYTLGQTITIEINGVEESFVLVGLYNSIVNNWVNPLMYDEDYIPHPSFITVGMKSETIKYFADESTVSKFHYHDSNSATNIFLYPELDPELEEIEIMQMHQKYEIELAQRELIIKSILIISIFIVVNIFLIFSRDTHKFLANLRLIGLNRKQGLIILLLQSIVFGLAGAIAYGLSYLISYLYYVLKYSTEIFSINVTLLYKTGAVFILIIVIAYLILNIKGLFSPLIGELVFPTTASIKLKKSSRSFAVFLLFFIVFFFLMRDTLVFLDQHLTQYEAVLANYFKSGYYIHSGGSIGEFGEVDLPCSPFVSNLCGIDKTEVKKLLEDKGLEKALAITEVNVYDFFDINHKQIIEDTNQILAYYGSEYLNLGVRLVILDEDNIDLFVETFLELPSDQFLTGQLAYIYDRDININRPEIIKTTKNFAKLHDGDTVLLGENELPVTIARLNEVEFGDERNLNYIEGNFHGNWGELIIHESLANKLGINTDRYQQLFFEPSFKADFKSTDRMMSKFATYENTRFYNSRILMEAILKSQRLQMDMAFLSLLTTTLVNFGILINIILIDILGKQKEFGLMSLLGKSKRMNIKHYYYENIKPWVLGIVSAGVFVLMYLVWGNWINILEQVAKSERGTFIEATLSYLKGMLTLKVGAYSILVLLVSNLLIVVIIWVGLKHVLDNNPLDNIVEREIK